MLKDNFTLSGVSAGTYVLTFAPVEELTSTPDEWDGVVVGYPRLTLSAAGRFEAVGEGLFWEDDAERVGESLTSEGGSFSLFNNGYIRSNRMGICIMVKDTERAPEVNVVAGETTEIKWEVLGR